MKQTLFILLLTLASAFTPANPLRAGENPTNQPLVTARDFYNAGTRLLETNKFSEAEAMFLSALATQDERVQPRALFNLAHARFAEGVEFLKQGPEANQVLAQGSAAAALGDEAIRSAQSALADRDVERMVDAYIAGRGARRELRMAQKAVEAAMSVFGKTLTKWQRAADDFRSAAELNPADTNATHNAKVVDQNIARLIDTARQLQQLAAKMAGQQQQLSQLLLKLKGQIPAQNAPPGSTGDGDEDDDGGVQPDSLKGKEENAGRVGERMPISLSPEEAGRLIDSISLDGSRRLPMTDQQGAKPRDKSGRNW